MVNFRSDSSTLTKSATVLQSRLLLHSGVRPGVARLYCHIWREPKESQYDGQDPTGC